MTVKLEKVWLFDSISRYFPIPKNEASGQCFSLTRHAETGFKVKAQGKKKGV
jgi:hypothetical protein